MEILKEVNTFDWISFGVVLLGAMNWGLEGLGQLAGRNLNLVDLLLTQSLGLPRAEALLYILVGLAGLYQVYFGYELYEQD